MFQQSPRTDGAGKGSPIYRALSALGVLLGIGTSILLTPLVFEWTRKPLFAYLSKSWGAETGNFLTWVFGCVEAGIILIGTHLIFTCVVVFGMTALAARRFPTG